MMKALSTLLTAAAVAGLAAMAQTANASIVAVSPYNVTDPPYTEGGLLPQKVGNFDGLYPAEWYPDATNVWGSDDANLDFPSQDIAAIADVLDTNTVFGELFVPTLTGYQLDSISGLSGAWTFDVPVYWVALHYDNKEAIWYFASGITAFGMSFLGGNQGLSNLRAWGEEGGGPPTIVPLPGAVWLFGSALVGLVTLSRRRRVA